MGRIGKVGNMLRNDMKITTAKRIKVQQQKEEKGRWDHGNDDNYNNVPSNEFFTFNKKKKN